MLENTLNCDFLKEIYGNSNGFITRFQKFDDRIKQYHYTAEQLFKLSFTGEFQLTRPRGT